MSNKYNDWSRRLIYIGIEVNGNGNIEINERDHESEERYKLTFSNVDTKEEIIERIGTEIYSWIQLMMEEM